MAQICTYVGEICAHTAAASALLIANRKLYVYLRVIITSQNVYAIWEYVITGS